MYKNIAIQVRELTKEFIIPHKKSNSLKQVFVNFGKKGGVDKRKVLNNISCDIYKGEFLGIIGRNGSGKSTLLKILAGVYTPTNGAVLVNGDLTPFIELGVGFNPELTGRENIFLNGALLGFTHKQMDAMYKDIVDFAELEEFMDQKLKNYSSGMQVRLAFSIAIRVKSDILLIDEVLAVGDSNFQKKCYGIFEDLKRTKKTIVFISHSMDLIKKFCDRVMVLNEGEIIFSGNPEKASYEYEILNQPSKKVDKNGNENQWGSKDVEIINTRVHDSLNNDLIKENSNLIVEVIIKNNTAKTQRTNLSFGIYSSDTRLFDSSTYFDKNTIIMDGRQVKTIKITFPDIQLLKGDYKLSFLLFGKDPGDVFHGWRNANSFTIVGSKDRLGLVDLKYKWGI